nr:unnamed protein product [Callosobruchus chinensis]
MTELLKNQIPKSVGYYDVTQAACQPVMSTQKSVKYPLRNLYLPSEDVLVIQCYTKMPRRQRDSDRIADSKTRKKRRKYEGLLKRLREKIAVSSTDTGSYDTQNSSDSDGESQITTVAEIRVHPVPEAAVAINSSDVMLDNNAHVCDFEFLGVKHKANNTASEPLHIELAVRWNTFLQGGVLKECRFKINYEKSTTDPTCELTCLGFTYNTLDMTLFLPEKKKRDTKDSLKKFKNKNKGSILFFSKLIGKLVAAGPTLKYGWVHIKNFEREKYLPLKKFNNNYNMPPLQIGAVIAMTAAFYALKSFGKNYKNCDILLRIDNKAAIACINEGGSI